MILWYGGNSYIITYDLYTGILHLINPQTETILRTLTLRTTQNIIMQPHTRNTIRYYNRWTHQIIQHRLRHSLKSIFSLGDIVNKIPVEPNSMESELLKYSVFEMHSPDGRFYTTESILYENTELRSHITLFDTKVKLLYNIPLKNALISDPYISSDNLYYPIRVKVSDNSDAYNDVYAVLSLSQFKE